MQNKLIILSFAISLGFSSLTLAQEAKVIKPKSPENRLGISNTPESTLPPVPKMASLQKQRVKNNCKNNYDKPVAYFDLDNKKIAEEIAGELSDEQQNILEDLRILWQSAVENSETIKFAIYKLSNPEGKKVDKGMVKKILSPIANVAPMIGMGAANPIAASSSIMGGGLLSSVLADDSAINAELSKVTDADLIILAKEIDDLQQQLVNLYYNYITAFKVLNYSDKVVNNRYNYYQAVSKKNSSNTAIADAFYRESLDDQYKARQEFMSTRAALEQFVGNEILIEVEKNLKSRILATK